MTVKTGKEKMLTPKQFAVRAGVAESTVYGWLARKQIKGVLVRYGFQKRVRIPETELLRLEEPIDKG